MECKKTNNLWHCRFLHKGILIFIFILMQESSRRRNAKTFSITPTSFVLSMVHKLIICFDCVWGEGLFFLVTTDSSFGPILRCLVLCNLQQGIRKKGCIHIGLKVFTNIDISITQIYKGILNKNIKKQYKRNETNTVAVIS